MDDSGHRKSVSRWTNPGSHRAWCCSFGISPKSPKYLTSSRPKTSQKSEILSKSGNSYSPQTKKSGLGLVGRIDRRRIKSPGRVSPINSDSLPENVPETSPVRTQLGPETFHKKVDKFATLEGSSSSVYTAAKDEGCSAMFDVRLSLKGNNGGCLVLELNSEVLCANSSVFANLVSDCRRASSGSAANLCRIEVPDVQNLGVFRETIELMFEDNISRRLLKVGVSQSIDILEISASILFTKGILSCMKYLEAVPWSEDEEEKLKNLFTKYTFEEAISRDVLARLCSLDAVDSQQHLAIQLVWEIIRSYDINARNELKCLVKGLLSRSSVYEKNHVGLNKEDLYIVSHSCLDSLVGLFEEASNSIPKDTSNKNESGKSLIERISRQVDNINWLLEILLDQHIAEDFVGMWAEREDLLKMHKGVSPMVRYEISRISASIFIALGTGKLHCRTEMRSMVLQAWFGPMLLDFGWLQRCKKGLDVKTLEEGLGQALLTLPMKHQYLLFMEWSQCFSKKSGESPNLSAAFQVWWRRCFLRGSVCETRVSESR